MANVPLNPETSTLFCVLLKTPLSGKRVVLVHTVVKKFEFPYKTKDEKKHTTLRNAPDH
jgi:hypothetical protein